MTTTLTPTAPVRTLTHLQALESEAIHIFREVAATFANPPASEPDGGGVRSPSASHAASSSR